MATATRDEVEEVDLSKLISFGMTFQPLQLTLRDILRRLAQLETQKTSQDDRIAELSANVDSLEEANKALEARVAALADKAAAAVPEPHVMEEEKKKDEGESAEAAGADSDAIWDEIARLNSLLGELQEGAERDRHTIDEIYAARKRHDSVSAAAGAGAAAAAQTGAEGEPRKKEEVAMTTAVPKPTQPTQPTQPDRATSASAPATAAAAAVVAPPPPSVSRKSSVACPLREAEESAPTKPVGDVILEKAREELQFDGTQVYTDSEEAAPTAQDHRVFSAAQQQHQQQQPSPRTSLSNRSHSVSIAFSASRPTSGGEDAGEHRGSVALSGASRSRLTASQAPRRSIYADQRIAAAAARRASQCSAGQPTEAALPIDSVFDKLRRDGDDIAYLNRVVAEILGEMKGLHADVDQLRTSQETEEPVKRKSRDGSSATMTATATPAGASLADLDEVHRRLAGLEGDLTDARQQLQHRDDGLQAELDELKKQLRAARNITDDDLDALRNLHDLADRLRQLEERVRALEVGQGALSEQFASVLAVGKSAKGGDATSEVNPLQLAALQGAVKSLEKQLTDLSAAQGSQQDWAEQIRKLAESVRALEGEVETARDQLQRTAKETARLDEVKANKSQLPDPALLLDNRRRSSAEGSAVADLLTRMTRAEAGIERLGQDKADRIALQKLRDELNALRQLVEVANAQQRDGDNVKTGRASAAALEKAVRDLQVDVNNLKDTSAHHGSGGGGGVGSGLDSEDLEDLRDRIERLDHCKADATLVANKAERDYVENALERLMREVEQVLNATNAGLIDTLEKSLNILRDMIDGKATKQDVANLQGWMAESGAGMGAGVGAGGADGLTGFKGFRCLGCNRPMENMRPRTLPPTMTPFLNRNPQNFPQDNVTRTIQQQQQRLAAGPANSFTAGARPAATTMTTGSPDASLHRSTNSVPLPPIEPA